MAINWDKYQTYDTSNGFGNSREWKRAFHERMGMDEATRIINDQSETPAHVLGVSETATKAEIKAAFRTLIQKWHPDKNPGNQVQAEEMSKKIIAAYTVLMDRK